MKQIENTLQDLKCMLIEDGYTEANIVMITLIKAQEQVKNCCIPDVVNRRELLLDFADYSERDKTSETTDECVDNYLYSIK